MPDLHAINLHLQERLEREWRAEVGAAEAAVWLDEAGLLRNHKNGLPLRKLLRGGRIAGQEQRPNKPNGQWWIRRLATSPDSHEIQRARQWIQKVLPINTDILPQDWPLSKGNPAFWEELGKTVAAFGYLEDTLGQTCYTLAGTPERETMARDEGIEAFSKWFEELDASLTDGMHTLTRKLDEILEEDRRIPHAVRTDLVKQLDELRPWRNALCHGAWFGFSGNGSGVLNHYYMSKGIPVNFPPMVSVGDLAEVRARAVNATIRLVETASMAGAGFALTLLPRKHTHPHRACE